MKRRALLEGVPVIFVYNIFIIYLFLSIVFLSEICHNDKVQKACTEFIIGGNIMKKLFYTITAVLLSVAMIFSFAGCKDNVNPPDEKVSDVRLIYQEIVADDFLLEKIANDASRYRNIITDDFGYGESGADKFYENYAEYYVYGMTLKVLNYTDSPITLKSIESDSNGKNGVYIRKSFNGVENGIGAKLQKQDFAEGVLTLHVLNENLELSDEQVVGTVRGMNLTLTYTDGASEKKLTVRIEDNVEVTQSGSVDEVIRFSGTEFGIEENLKTIYSDEKTHKSTIAGGFGLGEKGAEKFFASPEKYQTFVYNVKVDNLSDKSITIHGVKPLDNGKDGVYVKPTFSGEMGVPANSDNSGFIRPPLVIHVINSDPGLLDDSVMRIVDEMRFEVTYAEKVEGDDPYAVGEIKTAEVKIN